MKKKRHVYLTGLMGSGKTTIGKLVARSLGRPFIDLDKEIEKKENRSINDIFDQDGEAYFRKVESEVLQSLEPERYMVVATGGGIILDEGNREEMKKKGHIIYLNVPIEKLANRLNDDYERPLLKNKEKEAELLELNKERQPLYRDGAYELDTGNLTPLQASKEIVEVVK